VIRILQDIFRKHAGLLFCLAHALQLFLLVWMAAHAQFCCDADYYVTAGQAIWHDGLLWQDPYAGYRFYFPPLFFGMLERIIGASSSVDVVRQALPFALAATFALTSALASIHVLRREGIRRWALFAVPLLFNPFILAMTPYPLQESVVIIFAVPLLFILLARRAQDFRLTCLLAASFSALTFVARPSWAWVSVAALLLLALRATATPFRPRRVKHGLLVAAVVSIALVAPQCYVSWNKFGTFNPLAQTDVASFQLVSGVERLNYSTIHDNGNFGGFFVPSPYQATGESQKGFGFYRDHPAEGVVLIISHVWSGLHYLAPEPYMARAELKILNPWLLLSSLVVAFGLLGVWRMCSIREQRDTGWFLCALLVFSCAYTAFVGTEGRFGLIGFAALSVSAWQLLMDRKERGLCARALPLVIVYACLCLAFNALLLYRTNALWPASGAG